MYISAYRSVGYIEERQMKKKRVYNKVKLCDDIQIGLLLRSLPGFWAQFEGRVDTFRPICLTQPPILILD